MNIAILNMPTEYFSAESGGAVSTVILHQARQLMARGHHVTVITPADEHAVYPSAGDVVALRYAGSRSRPLAVPLRKLSGLRGRVMKYDWPHYEHWRSAARAALRAARPDVVIVHNDLAAVRWAKAALPATKVVAWMHNELRSHTAEGPGLAADGDLFVAVSGYIRDWAGRTLRIPREKLASCVNGCDIAAFRPREGHLEPVSPVRVLYVGRIDRNKGPDLAADAVAELRRRGLAVEMTVAGALWWYGNDDPNIDPYYRELDVKMKQAGATFLGAVPRTAVAGVMAAHDVLCVLSRSQDPCPLAPLEGMAAGLAILASRRGGIPEACGEGAVLVEPQAADVTAALAELAGDARHLARMKGRAVERAAGNSWQHHGARLEALLAGVTAGTRQPAGVTS